jgi:hypothetical protein
LRRFNDRKEKAAADAVTAVFGEGTTAEQGTLFRSVRRPSFRRTEQRWCRPCDALYVIRVGRVMCWRCGILWEP